MTESISVQKASEILGISCQSVILRIEHGFLAGELVNGHYRTELDSVISLLRRLTLLAQFSDPPEENPTTLPNTSKSSDNDSNEDPHPTPPGSG